MSTADTSMGNGDTAGPGQESLTEMSLIDHLTELRYRMFVSVGAIMVAAIICWFLSEHIYNILVQPVTRVLEAYPD